jgi:hypothetical protein
MFLKNIRSTSVRTWLIYNLKIYVNVYMDAKERSII